LEAAVELETGKRPPIATSLTDRSFPQSLRLRADQMIE